MHRCIGWHILHRCSNVQLNIEVIRIGLYNRCRVCTFCVRWKSWRETTCWFALIVYGIIRRHSSGTSPDCYQTRSVRTCKNVTDRRLFSVFHGTLSSHAFAIMVAIETSHVCPFTLRHVRRWLPLLNSYRYIAIHIGLNHKHIKLCSASSNWCIRHRFVIASVECIIQLPR